MTVATTLTASPALASAGSNAVIFAIVIGVVVVALLIAAFWWGSRRAARRRHADADPTRTTAQGARDDSWTTPDADPDLGDSRR
ncbi:DUF6479 family protein [Streptomyces sp. Je 1-79]|uniref:DUF6479 family protein n=1 Tax=Streptomyces sp. Je 1-79 TaxID=2943847 RepID=UPI0021A6D3D5|nr:DUF6479 family protein [Streptomyces sp. Je 1-79]MCT4353546.1 DUF6479 family protein [Streptomyces sp. Je 1-79]